MPENASRGDASLSKLEAVVDEELLGANPEVKRMVADVRGEPLDAESNVQSGDDMLQLSSILLNGPV